MMGSPDVNPSPLGSGGDRPLEPAVDPRPWVRLDTYDQSWYKPGRSKVIILLWWLLQAVVFSLTPHASHGPRCWLLRRFGCHHWPRRGNSPHRSVYLPMECEHRRPQLDWG
jgi:putative colanic acid biosynthesis acetyltransferase WcaF